MANEAPDFDPTTLDEDGLLTLLAPLVELVESCGFVRDARPETHHPTWIRERDAGTDEPEPDLDKLVLWRHPRMLHTLHGHVATTRVEHMVHLRVFDPSWQPEVILPGHIDKGWRLESLDDTHALVAMLRDELWPRALTWFESPEPAEAVMAAHGRVPSMIAPGPLLERHRERADWLEAQGRDDEAERVRAMVARVEAMFTGAR